MAKDIKQGSRRDPEVKHGRQIDRRANEIADRMTREAEQAAKEQRRGY